MSITKEKYGHCGRIERSKTYNCWRSMRQRAGVTHRNSKSERRIYERSLYAERGITVCPEWASSFSAFLADMGEAPPEMSLDRIDNDKGYYRENCRWATTAQQLENRRNTVWITYEGETRTQADWARRLGFHSSALSHRTRNGQSPIEAMTAIIKATEERRCSQSMQVPKQEAAGMNPERKVT